MTHKEGIDALNNLLGELTTAENAEQIAKGKDLLSSLGKEYDAAHEEGQKAKDSLVRLVQNMPVKNEEKAGPPDPTHESTVSLDDAIAGALESIEKAKADK